MEIVLTIAVVFIIAIPIALVKVNQTNKLNEDGTIIKREYGFWKKKHYFILKNGEFDRVANEFNKLPRKGFASQVFPEKKAIAFQSSTWKGQLIAEPAPAGMNVYSFVITNYQTRKEMPYDPNGMNAALTVCEKALLNVDPMTQVGSKDRNLKTTPHFF